jgi:hypothetical protein
MWITTPPVKLCGYCAGENWIFKSTGADDLVRFHKFDEIELEKYPYIKAGRQDFIVHQTLKSVGKDFKPLSFWNDNSVSFMGCVPVTYIFILDILTLATGFIVHKLFLGLFARFVVQSTWTEAPIPLLIVDQITCMSE